MRRKRNCLTINFSPEILVGSQGFLQHRRLSRVNVPVHVISGRLQEALGSLGEQRFISTKEVNKFHLGLTTGAGFALWITCDLFEMLIYFLAPGPLGPFSQEVLNVLEKYKLISISAWGRAKMENKHTAEIFTE